MSPVLASSLATNGNGRLSPLAAIGLVTLRRCFTQSLKEISHRTIHPGKGMRTKKKPAFSSEMEFIYFDSILELRSRASFQC